MCCNSHLTTIIELNFHLEWFDCRSSPEVFQEKLDELISTKKPKAEAAIEEDQEIPSETPPQVSCEVGALNK